MVDAFGYVTHEPGYFKNTPVLKVISDAIEDSKMPGCNTLENLIESYARGIEHSADAKSHEQFLGWGFPDYRNDQEFLRLCRVSFGGNPEPLAKWAINERCRVTLASIKLQRQFDEFKKCSMEIPHG